MLKLVPNHLKTKMCDHAVKRLQFLIRYFPDRCKTKQMYDRAILENGITLGSIPVDIRSKKCVIKSLIIMFMCYCPSLFAKRPKKCKIKLSVLILSQYDLFLNTIKLKKCVIKLLILVFCISFCF